MLSFFLASPAPAEGSAPDGYSQIIQTVLMFGAIILIFYFMMIRPQQKRAKEHQKLLSSVKRGDTVVTSSGIHGTVSDVGETNVTVTIAQGCNVVFEKSAIASVVAK